MTRLRTNLGLVLALAVATPCAWAQGSDDFKEGIDLLARGRKDEALAAFQRVLAAEPSAEEAYEIWKTTDDSRVWLDMLTAGGEFELVAKRIMDLARQGRLEKRNDEAAIKDLLSTLRNSEDSLERTKTIRELAANHGEYAVVHMLPALADQSNDDWRVVVMNALRSMDTDVVPPLIEALESEDVYQRRNVALVLGYIGDPRAAGPLTAVANNDADGGVKAAASEAAQACGSMGDALQHFLQDGDDYHFRRDNVLRDIDYSDVVWDWAGNTLESREVPRATYNNELSKKAYYRALMVDPSSVDALAGIARACTDIESKLAALAEAGEDVEDQLAAAREGSLAVAGAGPEALDRALQWSVLKDDSSTGTRLCRALGHEASSVTEGLNLALASDDGGMSSEAAVALAHIATRSGGTASAEVVSTLAESVSREIVRIAAVIDGNPNRLNQISSALSGDGVLVNPRGSGANGLAMLHRVPGIDVIIVGDLLPDMTLDQLLRGIANNAATADTPVYLASSNEDTAGLYESRVAGVLEDATDMSALDEVFNQTLSGDRGQANALAERAAVALHHLAQSGRGDVSVANDALAGAVGRDDAIAIPCMGALGLSGTANHAPALVAVAVDAERDDAARIAAANALGVIASRHQIGGDAAAGLNEVLTSDASLEVRRAVSSALGRMNLDAAARAELIRSTRRLGSE